MTSNPTSMRKRIAREAANLLYSGAEKEYKQAKLKAAKTSGVHLLPTNLEVAIELDRIADENEGPARQDRLVQMRKEALDLMRILEAYQPLLMGSVWRGTIHRGSDIDIVICHDKPEDVITVLKQSDVRIARAERMSVTKKGKRKDSYHIYGVFRSGAEIEIKVSSTEEITREEKCEIYGDRMTGLSLRQLEKLVEENPLRRYLP